MRRSLSLLLSLAFVALLAPLGRAQAQAQAQAPGGQAAWSNPGPLVVHPLSPTIYWVQGAGGNVGVIVGDRGVIVIDTKVSPAGGRELLQDIAKLTPKPVTAVILTHADIDHVGGLVAFPAGIRIIAQKRTQQILQAEVAAGKSPVPKDRLPNETVVDRETLRLEGVKLELLHWAPAHTAGDLVIYLPEQKIVFTGDIFTMDQLRPLIHLNMQGSSAGWIQSAQGVMSLDAQQFIVGHGDPQTRQALQHYIAVAKAERQQIKTLVAKGESLAQIQQAVGDPPPGQAGAQASPFHLTPFSEVVYQELTQKK